MILTGSEEEKLLEAIKNRNIEKVKSILKRSTKNKKKLNLNIKNIDGQYPLLWAIIKNNKEIVQLLIDYTLKHQIILELNEKDNYGWYPLYWAIFYNNIEIVQLLIDYALQHQIILEYDKKKLKINQKLKNYYKIMKKKVKNIKR